MSDSKMTIDDINDLMHTIMQACILLRGQIGHDFGCEINVESVQEDKVKFKLIFEQIDD